MNYLAIDLGAESGRVILGSIEGNRITLEEIHRFPNGSIQRGHSLFWKFGELTQGILDGLLKASYRELSIESISADSWGVDYVMTTAEVFNYRDPRGQRGVEKLFTKISWEKIFEETGIQFMPINTLFQLAAEEKDFHSHPPILSIADYFNFRLGGEPVIEESMASTFQLYNPRTRAWSSLLSQALGIPQTSLPKVVPSGTVIGSLEPLFKFPKLKTTPKIIATCSHDTGCAVAAVPAQGENWAYLSSGTWSLMGVEIPPISANVQSSIFNFQSSITPPTQPHTELAPIITDRACELNFTNEIGYNSTIRLLKNISGMWLLQECRRIWAEAGQNFDYPELTRLAESEPTSSSLIDPMDPRFLAPPNMPEAIANYCREHSQPIPTTPAQFTRCIFESLAQLYAKTLHQLEELTAKKIDRLHIVGGGSKNAFLNQLTANACRIPIHAGPVEATALGNIIIQAITAGEIENLPTARKLIAANFPPATFHPS